MSRPDRIVLALAAALAAASSAAPAPARAQAAAPPAASTPPASTPPLTLATAVQRALERNERARIALARTEAAQARLDRARAVFWPDLTLTGNYTHKLFEPETSGFAAQFGRDFNQSQDVFTATAALTATLFDFRAYPLLRQARLAESAARLTEAEERRALAFEAAQAFVSTLGAEQVVQAAERRVALSTQSLTEARARAEARLASTHDVTRAELELRTAESTLAQARATADQARLGLALLLDYDGPEALGSLAAPGDARAGAPEPAHPPADARKALERRADLEARRTLLRAQEELASEPGRRFVPTLKADAQYRLSSEEQMGGRNDDASVGLTLSWPIFDGFERDAEALERRAVAREQAAALELAARTVTRDVRAARLALETQQTLALTADRAANAAVRNAQEASALYSQGLAQAFEVADAQARQFEAEVALTRAALGVVAARLQLSMALGEWPAGVTPPAAAGTATP
jgi:outer membrane protein TolC